MDKKFDMDKIKLKLRICNDSLDLLSSLKDELSYIEFNYKVLDVPVSFIPRVSCHKKAFHYKEEIWDEYYEMEALFECDFPGEFDVKNNDVYYYSGPMNLDRSKQNARSIKQYFSRSVLDETFSDQIDLFCRHMVLTLILVFPELNIEPAHFVCYLDEQLFFEKNYINSLLLSDISRCPVITKTQLTMIHVWNWINKNTTLNSFSKCPALSTIHFLLNRDYHEILLYSVIGLESLYSKKNSRGISFVLQNRLTCVFPNLEKSQIRQIYKARSDLVHGLSEIEDTSLFLSIIEGPSKYKDSAILACALLFESIRLLIKNDATEFVFEETIRYKYQ